MVIQFVNHPDASLLDATVILDRLFGSLKLEPDLDRLEQILLIALDREMKVSAFADEVSGRIASTEIVRPRMSIDYSVGMKNLISLDCFSSSESRTGSVPTFFHSSNRCGDRSRSLHESGTGAHRLTCAVPKCSAQKALM